MNQGAVMPAALRASRLFGLACGFLSISPAMAALNLEVVRGDGTNNNVPAGLAATAVIRVRDESGKPVRGALVIFSAPAAGPSVEFSGTGPSANVVTDESGTAVAPRSRAAGSNGPLEIRVMASRAGEVANAVIHQMNLGLGVESIRATELDLVEVPQEAGTGKSKHRPMSFAVRVQDGNGVPVKGATVSFTLRKLGNSSKTEEVAEAAVTAGENGEALTVFSQPPVSAHLECMVQATFGDRKTTAFFTLH